MSIMPVSPMIWARKVRPGKPGGGQALLAHSDMIVPLSKVSRPMVGVLGLVRLAEGARVAERRDHLGAEHPAAQVDRVDAAGQDVADARRVGPPRPVAAEGRVDKHLEGLRELDGVHLADRPGADQLVGAARGTAR